MQTVMVFTTASYWQCLLWDRWGYCAAYSQNSGVCSLAGWGINYTGCCSVLWLASSVLELSFYDRSRAFYFNCFFWMRRMNFCGLYFLSHTLAETCLVIQGIICFFSNALVHILAHSPRAVPWYPTWRSSSFSWTAVSGNRQVLIIPFGYYHWPTNQKVFENSRGEPLEGLFSTGLNPKWLELHSGYS